MSKAGRQIAGELQTERTTLRRKAFRGHYDFETIAAILDEAFICHVGFVAKGQPYVIPTGYGRRDRHLYFHGLSVNHMLDNLKLGIPICFTATLVDGMVFARSGFNHSINFRSVVVLGKAELVEGEEQVEGLKIIMEHMLPGRWNDTRAPNAIELKATSVLRLPITEASAKIREGGPIDDEEDFALPYWAGVVPFETVAGPPITEGRVRPGTPVPEYALNYRRPKVQRTPT
ncbi:MAG: pyridoxamine 5'-phosphate oxidase family protein [Burkholderiales bacterium]